MKKKVSILGIVYLILITLFTYKMTYSLFSDSSTSTANVFAAATSFPTPTPETTSHIVINEVYYDPDEEHSVGGTDSANSSEWVEIYNPTSSTVNLQNWKITDNSGTERTVSTSNRNLGPGEFAILAKAANVRAEWGFASEILIPIGEIFGNGFANTGDRVILKDNNGNIVDQISYGTDTTILNPSITDVAQGHSIERDPDGLDTDSNTDFVNRTTPTPGS